MVIINNQAQVAKKGLSISYTNVLESITPTVTSPLPGEVPANISDPDHSLNYTSGTQNSYFQVSYGLVQNVTYVAISGHNAAVGLGATIELYDEATLVQSVTITRNHNIMFTFDQRSFVDMSVKFVTPQATQQVTVSFIAAGKHINIPTGEQAGYSRNWLVRQTEQATASNLYAAPVGTTQKNKPLSGMLSLPHQLATFSQGDWQTFIDFSYDQPFFIKEVDSKPESSYVCFDPSHDIKAHTQTRARDVISLRFSAFNGL